MFTTIEMMNVNNKLLRNFLNHINCGDTTLQVIIDQYAHQYGPAARLKNAYASYSTPEYQEINNSVIYAVPTMEPVTMITMFMYSTCLVWM
ncbi:hypothetical protein D3C85_1488080 [compost metagenome]